MHLRRTFFLILVTIALMMLSLVVPVAAQDMPDTPIGVQEDGSVIVPSNQVLRPAGTTTQLGQRPVDMVLSPDGSLVAMATVKSTYLPWAAHPSAHMLRPMDAMCS